MRDFFFWACVAISPHVQNLGDLCVCCIVFWLVGYGFATGDAGNAFIGAAGPSVQGGVDFIFNAAFAATSATVCVVYNDGLQRRRQTVI